MEFKIELNNLMRMRLSIKILIRLFFIFLNNSLYSQQNEKTSLFVFAHNLYNPGASGVRSSLTLGALSRNQWWGVKGAPSSSRIYINSPLGDKMGYGADISYFSIGARNFLGINGDFSYKIVLSNKGNGHRLSLGARWSLDYYSFNVNDFNNIDQTNFTNLNSIFSTNFGVGAFFYSTDYYVSLSSMQVFDIALKKATDFAYKLFPINYLGAGYVHSMDGTKLKFDIFMQHSMSDNSINIDSYISVFLAKKIWLGLSYKGGTMNKIGDFGFFTSINLTRDIKLAYSYDYSFGEIGKFTKIGTHEFMLTYQVVLRKSGIRGVL